MKRCHSWLVIVKGGKCHNLWKQKDLFENGNQVFLSYVKTKKKGSSKHSPCRLRKISIPLQISKLREAQNPHIFFVSSVSKLETIKNWQNYKLKPIHNNILSYTFK